MITNAGNESMVGKFLLENLNDVDVPMYDSFNFIGAEKEEYKLDKNNFIMEIYSQGDMLNFGEIVFKLPNPIDILEDITENLEEFIK
jgi:hypothetical protein